MKKASVLHILVLIVTAHLSYGCSLDLPLENNITDPDVVTDGVSAHDVLSPAYRHLPYLGLSLSVLSSDFAPTVYITRSPELQRYYSWDAGELQNLAQSTWDAYYEVVAVCNNVLERTATELTELDATDRRLLQTARAEAMGLKAFAYFRLLNLFATPYSDTAHPLGIVHRELVGEHDSGRRTKDETLAEIDKLLAEALRIFEQNKINAETPYNDGYDLGPRAIEALQIYKAAYAGQWGECLQLCRTTYLLRPDQRITANDLDSSFWEGRPNDARGIWNLQTTQYDFLKAIFNFETTRPEQQLFHLNPALLPEADRPHRDALVLPSSISADLFYLGKYNVHLQLATARPVAGLPILSPVGLLFLYTEALLRTGDTAAANDILQHFFAKKDHAFFSGKKEADLMVLLRLKQSEQLGDGDNFFDLKRLNVSRHQLDRSGKKVSSIAADDYRWTWPIPRSEYTYNDLITQQNPGWPDYNIDKGGKQPIN